MASDIPDAGREEAMPIRSPKPGGPLLNGAPRRSSRFGWNMGLRPIIWIAVLVASAASVLVAASQNRPGLENRSGLGGSAFPGPTPRSEGQNLRDLSALKGFQKRGNALVGDLRTSDGTILRLVLDARSHALIGFKIVENPPEEAACRRDGAIAPLPATAPPAN